MRKLGFIGALLTATLWAASACAAPTLRPGAWETRIDGDDPDRVCYGSGVVMDLAGVTKMTASVSRGSCSVQNFKNAGSTVTYDTVCQGRAGRIVTASTVTALNADNLTSKAHTHFDSGPKRPDSDTSKTYHFVGTCKSGDMQAKF